MGRYPATCRCLTWLGRISTAPSSIWLGGATLKNLVIFSMPDCTIVFLPHSPLMISCSHLCQHSLSAFMGVI